MSKWKLYRVAKCYVEIIEKMERTRDPQRLADLEEARADWHDKLIQVLKREGIVYRDREHVTRLAYHILRESK